MNFNKLGTSFAYLLFCLLALNSCKKAEIELPSVIKEQDAEFYLLVDGRQLVKFNLNNLSTPLSSVDLSGMESAEAIVSIDFRPATGQLYGLGSTSRLYVINPETGMMRGIGAGPFSPALAGTIAGFDFNPTVDRIRVVTNSGQNLRLNPETGTVANTDGPVNGAAGASVTAVAYTNNKAGAATTVLYDIDVMSNKLFKQDPPNNGTLVEVGSLGEDLNGEGGFDIAPEGFGLAVYGDKIYSIDLANGKATRLPGLPSYSKLTGIAIRTEPVAYAVDLMNNLLIFNPMNPVVISKPITGAGDLGIEGIDFRPLNGQLYGIGRAGALFTINTSTGAATAVGSGTILYGSSFGFDFNPTVDRIRLVSNFGQNFRMHPETGVVTNDTPLNPAPNDVRNGIVAAAYTNNFAGATTTVLYDIDANTDKLLRQDPPNQGVLVDVGNLGVNVDLNVGFDIGGASGTAYAIMSTGGTHKIYTINLTNGSATAGATFPTAVRGFALGLGF